MEFRILGPLEVDDASGNSIRLPTGRERALLVSLLLHRGEVVSMDALIDALWGERAPATAAKAVQGYVSHLRRTLGPEAEAVIRTRSPGYVLDVGEAQLDSARFERLASEGRRALEDDDPTKALGALDDALGLWRGSALAEFEFEDFAQREIQRLNERRLEAAEDRYEALLQAGRHGGLISELESRVAAHPLRERLRGQLMLALYRSGRPADALQVYKQGARLSRELGLDPAAELRALERAILDQDPALAAPARPARTVTEAGGGLPSGTVTLLSSDIVGSTALLRTVGAEQWGEMLARHRAIMRGAFEAHGGSEVDTQGDAFFAAFTRAGDAVAAAVAVQRAHLDEPWPDEAEVRIRIGLHTGAPTPGPERYVGLDVHRVARVTATGHGGEILCTASTASLAEGDEHAHATFELLGEFALKDFPRPERLLRVVADGLPASFPPPAAERVDGVGRTRWRRRALIGVPVLALVAVLGVLALDRARESPAAIAVAPPAVAVIDPKTNRVIDVIRVGSRPVTMAADEDAVWVGDARDGTVTRIDPKTREIVKTIGVGAPAIDIAVSGGNVWVATGGFGTVVKIDEELSAEVDTIELAAMDDPVVPVAASVAAGSEGVWVGAFEGLVRVDPRSGELGERVTLDKRPALQIALGDGAVWSTTSSSRAKRIDARSAQETAEFYAGVFVYPIALDPKAVWLSGGEGQLWKLDPVTGTTLLTASVGSWIEGIAIDSEAVWVTLLEAGALVRVEPTTGKEVARITLGGVASEVVVANGLVWVSVHETEGGDEDEDAP